MDEPVGETPKRRRVGVLTAALVFLVGATAGLVTAAPPLGLSPRAYAAVAMLCACIATYELVKPKLSKVVVVGLTVALIAGAAVVTPDPVPGAVLPRADHPTYDRVTLTWPAAPVDAPIREYRLFRNGIEVYVGPANQYVDREVVAGESYEYALVVIGSTGNASPRSAVMVQVPTLSTSLPTPTGLVAQADSARSVGLTWAVASGSAPAFVVLRDGTVIGTVDRLSYEDTTVAPAHTYRYTVRSSSATGTEQSPDSEPVTVTTPAAGTTGPTAAGGGGAGGGGVGGGGTGTVVAPSAPRNLRRTAAAQTTITMAWSAASPGSGAVAGYRIYRGGQPRTTVPAGTLSYRDTGLSAGTSYLYYVRAYDAAGHESVDSAHVSMATTAVARTGSCTGSGSVWTCVLYANEAVMFNTGRPSVVAIVPYGGDFQFETDAGHAYYYQHFGVAEATPAACAASTDGPWDVIPYPALDSTRYGCRHEGWGSDVYSFVEATDTSRLTANPPSLTVRVSFVSGS